MIAIRPAKLDDEKLIFEWRNQPFIYESGFSGRPVSEEDHRKWFKYTLLDPQNYRIYIIEVGDISVGMIRFDRILGGDWNVSIYIEESCVGYGVGPEVIKIGCDKIRTIFTGSQIHASFISTNIRSKKAFAKAGFIRVTENSMRFPNDPA